MIKSVCRKACLPGAEETAAGYGFNRVGYNAKPKTMKTLNYFNEKDKENKFEILDNEELGKIKGGISDPPLV